MRALERIGGYGHVAVQYGLEEAIFLDSIMYWYKENRANGRNYRDGRWWTYNSVSALTQLFPWWSAKQLRRISESCRERGAILVGNYNEDQRDRTLWYTPGDELLELYGMTQTGGCICPNGRVDSPEQASMFAQMGKCNIEHVSTSVQNNMDPHLPPKPSAPEKNVAPKTDTPPDGPEAAEAVLDAYAGGDQELRERLREFCEKRRRKKKPLDTRRMANILTGRLDRLSGGDRASKLALLDNAILHSWDSVYPLKDDEKPGAPPGAAGAPLRGEGVAYT